MPVTPRPALVAAVLLGGLAGCDRFASRETELIAGGDPARGAAAIRAYGCHACHTIPGIPGADGLIGPPLGGLARRAYVGGVLSNTPANLIAWIRNPQAASPRTAMPNLGVGEQDARDIAAYLYTSP